MTSKAIPKAISNAIYLVKPSANADDLYAGCYDIISSSDLVHCAITPFTFREQSSMAFAIYYAITDPFNPATREVVLDEPRALLGSTIELLEFGAMFSSDFLLQHFSVRYRSLSIDECQRKAIAFFSALCFRYFISITVPGHVFYMSYLTHYISTVHIIYDRKDCELTQHKCLHETVLALQSLEAVSLPCAWCDGGQ